MRSAAVLMLLCACGAVSFDREQKIPVHTIPARQGPLSDYLLLLAKSDTGPASSANLKSMTFRTTDAGDTFDFVDSIHVYAGSFADDGTLPKIEIVVNRTDDVLPYIAQGARPSSRRVETRPRRSTSRAPSSSPFVYDERTRTLQRRRRTPKRGVELA